LSIFTLLLLVLPTSNVCLPIPLEPGLVTAFLEPLIGVLAVSRKSKPVALPAAVITAGAYAAFGGGLIAAMSQLTVEDSQVAN
jgi:hypothetical protein